MLAENFSEEEKSLLVESFGKTSTRGCRELA